MRTATLISLLAVLAGAQARPVELGRIDWLRDHDAALAAAKAADRPVMLLFQEVPG